MAYGWERGRTPSPLASAHPPASSHSLSLSLPPRRALLHPRSAACDGLTRSRANLYAAKFIWYPRRALVPSVPSLPLPPAYILLSTYPTLLDTSCRHPASIHPALLLRRPPRTASTLPRAYQHARAYQHPRAAPLSTCVSLSFTVCLYHGMYTSMYIHSVREKERSLLTVDEAGP